MRVVIADDEVLLREGLAHLLADAGFEIAGRCGDADALLAMVDARRPDVALDEREDLATLLVEPQVPRRAIEPDRLEMTQERRDRRAERPDGPAHGVADTHDRATRAHAPGERDLVRHAPATTWSAIRTASRRISGIAIVSQIEPRMIGPRA